MLSKLSHARFVLVRVLLSFSILSLLFSPGCLEEEKQIAFAIIAAIAFRLVHHLYHFIMEGDPYRKKMGLKPSVSPVESGGVR